MLNIKSLTNLYHETRTLAYANSRLNADIVVNNALDSKLSQESKWQRKQSITVYSENAYADAVKTLETNACETNRNVKIKEKIKQNVEKRTIEHWSNHVKRLTVQGKFIELLHDEQNNVTWQSIIYNLPKGTMQFIINASIDTLPTNANLKRWGKRSTAKCTQCQSRETIHHVLNNCEHKLDRYKWRHDNILYFITNLAKYLAKLEDKMSNFQIYADLQGHTVNGKTVPESILPCSLIPDIVIVQDRKVVVFELTVPFELNINNAHSRKSDKYSGLVSDIETAGYNCFLYVVEVGSRGYIDKQNENSLS